MKRKCAFQAKRKCASVSAGAAHGIITRLVIERLLARLLFLLELWRGNCHRALLAGLERCARATAPAPASPSNRITVGQNHHNRNARDLAVRAQRACALLRPLAIARFPFITVLRFAGRPPAATMAARFA